MTRSKGKALAKTGSGATDIVRVGDPVTVGADGSIRIDTRRLSPPQNIYDADYGWAVQRRGAVSLFFAKEDIQQPEQLRTRLELRYPYEGFYRHLWKNSRDFHVRLRDYLARHPSDGHSRPDPSKMRALKDHSDWVNVDYLAHSESHACLDFFNLSVVGIARFARGHGSEGLNLSPVVRVQMTAAELLRLLDDSDRIISELKSAGTVEDGDDE